jgi:hypothetical protein
MDQSAAAVAGTASAPGRAINPYLGFLTGWLMVTNPHRNAQPRRRPRALGPCRLRRHLRQQLADARGE